MSAVDYPRQRDSHGSETEPAAPVTLRQHMAGKQLQTVELGLPADSQVVSYQYLTRAKHSLAHVTIDELEETLQLPEEQLLPLEEVDVYENFLEALHLDELPEDDEEDIDFVLDELLFDSDLDEGVPMTPQKRSQNSAGGAAKKLLRSSGNAELLREMSVLPDESEVFEAPTEVPIEVLGVPACMMPDGPRQLIPGDQEYQMYGEYQEAPQTWYPEPPNGPIGFDCAQFKQLYRQLNQHCQLMIQVYSLTAPNSQHQQTAYSVRQMLDEYQAVTAQMLESGVEQMPHGKQYDLPYPSELLGTANASMPQATGSPGSAPRGEPSVQRQTGDASAAAASTANQSLQFQHAWADPQQAGQAGHINSSVVGTCGQQAHGQDQQQSQENQQQQTAAASSEITLTQPDAATAHAAEVTSVSQHPHQHQQQHSHQQQAHRQDQQQPQQDQQQQRQQLQAPSGSHCTQLEETGGVRCWGIEPRNFGGNSSLICSPAKHGTSGSPDHSSQAPWAPWADFDVHSVLEVAPMKLLPAFHEDMAKVPVSAEATAVVAAPAAQRKSKKVNRVPPPVVPAEVKQAVACFAGLFDPALFPRFQALPAQMTWTQGEDELLATGLLRFGQDWSRISLHIMPVKTIAEMRDRQKNRCHRVEGNCIRTAKEYITRPLEAHEIELIDRGLQYLEDNWEVQRQLEDLHGLQDSSHDPRMQHMNRWRLLSYVPHLGLQSRGGLILYQMYDEATGKKAKTTRVGAAPGVLDKKSKAPSESAPIQPAFVAAAASPDQQQKKKHGGSRQIVLDPPIYLLFDEPIDSGIERGAAVIAGRTAITRKPADEQTNGRQAGRRSARTRAPKAPTRGPELAEGVPAYPLDPDYLAGCPMAAPSAPVAFAQAGNVQQPSSHGHPVHVPNPFRVNLPEAPPQNLQQLLHNASQVLRSARTQGFEACTSHTQQQQQQQQQQPMDISWLASEHQGAASVTHLLPSPAPSTCLGNEAFMQDAHQQPDAQQADTHADSDWHYTADAMPDSAANSPEGHATHPAAMQQHASQQHLSGHGHGHYQEPNQQISALSGAQSQQQGRVSEQQCPAQPVSQSASAAQSGKPAGAAQQTSRSAGADKPDSPSPDISHQPDGQHLSTNAVPYHPQAVVATVHVECHSSPPQPERQIQMHSGQGSGSKLQHSHLHLQPEPQAQGHPGQGSGTKLEHSQIVGNPGPDAEEDFEQDHISQPATSEEDEDFEPDYLSQPESTTDDAFEVDEAMSQPSDTESDDNLAHQAAHVQVAATIRTDQAPQQATPAAPAVHPSLQGSAARLKLAVQGGSGRQGSKRAPQRPSPEDNSLPAAKRQHTSPEWAPGSQRRALLLTATHNKDPKLQSTYARQAALAASPFPARLSSRCDAATPINGTPATSAQQQLQERQPQPVNACPQQHQQLQSQPTPARPKQCQHPSLQPVPAHPKQPAAIAAAAMAGAAMAGAATAQAAPVSFRKRPRKAARPKCSGPVFCNEPDPPDSPSPVKSPGKQKPAAGTAVEPSRQLRSRQDVVGTWATKRARQPRKPSIRFAQQQAKDGGASPPLATHTTESASPDSSCKHQPQAAADREQAVSAVTNGKGNVVPVSDSQMMVDGTCTEWTGDHDRAILLVCIIQHQGHPGPEVFHQLVISLQQSGGQFTVRQVQARFEWMLQRFLQNLRQQS